MEQNSNETYGVAIDIGASKVSIFVGKTTTSGRIKIEAGSFVPLNGGAIKRGEIENPSYIEEALKRALTTIEKDDGIKIHRAIVGVTGQYIASEIKQESAYVKIKDEISQADVDVLMANARRVKLKDGFSLIDVMPLGYSIDGKTFIDNPIGACGDKLTGKFNVISGNDSKLNYIKRVISRNEVEVVDIIPFSLAAAEAVLTDEERELGVCLVDFGATTIEIAIYKDRKLRFCSTLPYGASLLNNDIKHQAIMDRCVESIKVQFGMAIASLAPEDVAIEFTTDSSSRVKMIPQRTVASIIEARMVEIIKGVKGVIISSGYSGTLAEGVVLTGGGAKLLYVNNLFEKILKYKVRIGNPDLRVDGISDDRISDTRNATAIGLLLKGLERGEDMGVEIIQDSVDSRDEVDVILPTEEEDAESDMFTDVDDGYDDNYEDYGDDTLFSSEKKIQGWGKISKFIKDKIQEIDNTLQKDE